MQELPTSPAQGLAAHQLFKPGLLDHVCVFPKEVAPRVNGFTGNSCREAEPAVGRGKELWLGWLAWPRCGWCTGRYCTRIDVISASPKGEHPQRLPPCSGGSSWLLCQRGAG